jgi:MIP family channel proteins
MPTNVRQFTAEFIGTFTLVFVGSGAIMMATRSGSQAALLAVAIAHALALGVMISALMHISAHFNSAVTIGFLVARRISPAGAAINIAGQLLGAVVAAWLLKLAFPPDLVAATRVGGQSVALDVGTGHAILLEAVGAFLLMFVIYGTAVQEDHPRIGGSAIGLTVGAIILAIGPLTGASVNPARSFGPAFISGVWEGHAVYWIGPIAGAIVAALVWEFVLIRRPAAVK